MIFGRISILLLVLIAILSLAPAAVRAAEEKGGPENMAQDPNAGGPIYVQIAPFVVPVIGENGPEEMVSLMITLEVATQEKSDYVRARLPKLNDAFMETLYGALDRGTIKRNGLINVTLMKDKLVKASNKVLGQGYIDDVLVQAMAERRLEAR
jgi:flagellar protein FliL